MAYQTGTASNIANLLQINMKPANEANKGKFE